MTDHPAASDVPFSFLVSLVEAFAAIAPTKADKTRFRDKSQESPYVRTLKNWVKKLREVHSPVPPGTTATFFRLFFPEEDVSRKYGLQETRLAGYLSDILAVNTADHARGASLRNWNEESAVGCLGREVHDLLLSASSSSKTSDPRSMAQIDALLTELASTSAFSSASVRASAPSGSRRKPREILRELYASATPSSASFITQIILKDLRPVLYPLKETHYSAQLLHYNSKAVCMLSKEQAMKVWDPTGKMAQAFRVRASLDEAADAFESPDAFVRPQVGVPIPIPKCLKGQSMENALDVFRASKKVWVETKYDGERAQIHVQIDERRTSKITIFSKSKRDSTLDRYAVHPIIREALGLPEPSSSQNCPEPGDDGYAPRIKQNIVVEAEMVAFSDTLDKIDEFWRIRSLIASTAKGVRGAAHWKPPAVSQENDWSQSSMISNGSDHGTRHLALVFFDILVLDSKSLLWEPYSARRALLEKTIRLRPGYAMLAERTPVLMACPAQAQADLESIFSRLQGNREEGAVLKADESKYNDYRLRWVKLKADYIPGYGDCLDLAILGAGWDKERARELLVGPSVYTTFYLGALSNAEAVRLEPATKPVFQIVFTVSYGLSREQLEELNFLIKNSDPVAYASPSDSSTMDLPYSFKLNPGLPRPSVMLQQPLLAEVFGAGFTKAAGSKFYELRFPRMTKYHRLSERSWTEGHTLADVQDIARDSVGRDRPGKDVDDWCKGVWGLPASPSVRSAEKRKERADEWLQSFQTAGGTRPVKARRVEHAPAPARPKRGVENRNASEKLVPQASPLRARALGSMTNVLPTTPPPREPPAAPAQLPTPKASDNPPARRPLLPDPVAVGPPVAVPAPGTATATPATLHASQHRKGVEHLHPVGDAPDVHDVNERSNALPSSEAVFPRGRCTIRAFLDAAVVWFARDCITPRPSWRAPSRSVIPHGQQVQSLAALLTACGWTQGVPACDWAQYGVVFVDDADPDSRWADAVIRPLAASRAAAVAAGGAPGKPIVMLGMSMLARDALDREVDVLGSAICRFG